MAIESKKSKFALFFSHGVSLQTWEDQGLFDREVGYYQHLRRDLGGGSFRHL